MARQRDYRAEYQRRQSKAQAAGWESYWHERQTRAAASQYTGASRRTFLAIAKSAPMDLPDLSAAEVRSLFAEGHDALAAGDTERAREIAERLGWTPPLGRDGTPYPPESMFWYH